MNGFSYKISLLAVLFTVSCATTVPETQDEDVQEQAEVFIPKAETAVLEHEQTDFDAASITPEIYIEIKENIIEFIHELNTIIRSKDYQSWREHLDDDYYSYISSPEYLQKVSNTGIMQKNGIVLTTANEYFVHVVVPSRSRDRVDDIEVTGANKVKVITVDKGVRLRLYDLEKTKSGWKIVMPDSVNLLM
jgi:hypothetical protein